MTREQAHLLVDKLFDENGEFLEDSQLITAELPPESEVTSEPVRVLPEGKRVVRTKTSGDRVYLIDEVKKTRHWTTNPEVLDGLGFKLEDVQEVEDSELLRYQMGPAIYRVEPT